MYQTTALDNGVRVISAHMPYMQSLSLGFWIKTGGRYETQRVSGISHFLEHLLFEGTKTHSSKQIKQAIEGLGGSLNGFTSEEVTCYLVKCLGKYSGLSIDILSDMVLNPAFRDASIEKERSVITEEIKMYLDLPSHFVGDLLNELMWPGHPLGMFLTGTTETINAIKRRDLIEYKEKSYVPNNIVISAAGPVTHQEIVRMCRRHFSNLHKKPVSRFKPASVIQKEPMVNLRYKDTEQMHIAMGLHSVSSGDPDKFAMGLLNVALGANMSSRLFQEVREKRGLAYEIGTGLKKYQDAGAFVVSAGVKNTELLKAVEVILKELKAIKRRPPSRGELKRAKEFYTGQMLMALEDTTDHMLWIGEQVILLNKVLMPEEILTKIEKITAADLSRVAEKHFRKERLNLAVIGPVKEVDRRNIKEILEIL